MPRFFFDLATPAGIERDALGTAFPGIEPAYLDACRAALEISIDMLRERQDPRSFRFEVRDQDRALLLEVPFTEVLQPNSSSGAGVSAPLRKRLHANLGRARLLKAQIAAELLHARRELEVAQATLRRGSS